MTRRVWPCVIGALAAGCDEGVVVSEGERFELIFAGMQTEKMRGWDAPYRVLVGTEMCPQVKCDGAIVLDTEVVASGPVSADGAGCFVAEGPGEIEWTVGAPCGDLEAPTDRAVMTVVDAAEVAAEAVLWPDRAVAGDSGYAAVGAAFHPADEPLPGPLPVVEGSQVALPVRVYTRADGHVVGWSDGAVTLTRDEGRAPVAYPGPRLELVTFAGSTATATFAAGGGTWPLGQVRGVAADAATSLAIAAAQQGEGEAPLLARAVARDADGGELFGLPVTWSVFSGELALAVDADLPGQDYVRLADACLPPDQRGGPRSAVITARHADLSASLELQWEGTKEEADPTWERPDACPEGQGCGCRASDAQGWWGVALLGLLARRRRPGVATGLLAATLVAGCSGGPPAVTVKETRALGALRWDPAVAGRDGGYSARVGERSVWVFGDTGGRTPPGHFGFANNTSCSTTDLDARDGLFPLAEHLDEEGYLLEFVPLTAAEEAYEQAHGDPSTCEDACEGVALWPGPLVHDPERQRVLVMYAKLFQRPGYLNITVVGTSIAVWNDELVGVAERPEVAPGSDEPTLMFRDGEFQLATAALAVDGDLLAYSCEGDGFDRPCRLGRVPLADALRREAWRFYAGGSWSSDQADADELFQGAPMMTVHWNEHAGAYIAAYVVPAGNEIEVRTAPAPEGPWSDAATVVHGRTPVAGSSSYGGLMHPELSRDGGRVEYVTYYLEPTGTIELVEITWN